jgi:hypothetical protein
MLGGGWAGAGEAGALVGGGASGFAGGVTGSVAGAEGSFGFESAGGTAASWARATVPSPRHSAKKRFKAREACEETWRGMKDFSDHRCCEDASVRSGTGFVAERRLTVNTQESNNSGEGPSSFGRPR